MCTFAVFASGALLGGVSCVQGAGVDPESQFGGRVNSRQRLALLVLLRSVAVKVIYSIPFLDM